MSAATHSRAAAQPVRSGNDPTSCLPAAGLRLMGMTVWIDGWPMQCCGKPFRLGSRVAWTLGAADPDWLEAMLGEQQTVDAAEEHHGGVPEDTAPTRGR